MNKPIVLVVQNAGKIKLPTRVCTSHGLEPGDEIEVISSDNSLLVLLPPRNKRPAAYRELFQIARKVFESESSAATWLHRVQHGLGGVAPIEAMTTAAGAAEIKNLLKRIEYSELA